MIFRLILVGFVALMLSGCGEVSETMGPTEVGVRYRDLPPPLGGVSEKVVKPGQTAFLLWPFDSIYRFDASEHDIAWPGSFTAQGKGGRFVNTRASDGNEVALAITIRYRVMPDAESLMHLIGEGATSDSEVQQLVTSVARSHIRTAMSRISTAQFLIEKDRYEAIDKAQHAMQSLLEPYGIRIVRVILDDFRFERLLSDGRVDDSYQEKLTEIQKMREDTDRERARIRTVEAKKQQELKVEQARVNRLIEEATGYKNQAVLKGDAYDEAKRNEAQGILALGKAEGEGLKEQVAALKGRGGRELLKLEIARQLREANPRFVVVNQGEGSMALQRLDTNELLGQVGIVEALREKQPVAGAANPQADEFISEGISDGSSKDSKLEIHEEQKNEKEK